MRRENRRAQVRGGALVLLAVVALSAPAWADSIQRANGSELQGTILDLALDGIQIDTGQVVPIKVPLKDLKSPTAWSVSAANTDPTLLAAQQAFANADFKSAIDEARSVAQSRGSDKVDQQRAAELWARAALAAGNSAEALKAVDVLLKDFPNTIFKPWALETRGRVALANNQLDKARGAFDELSGLAGYELAGKFWSAYILMRQGKFGEAQSNFESIVGPTLKRDNAALYAQAVAGLGLCLQKTGRLDAAVARYEEAVSFAELADEEMKGYARAGLGDHYWTRAEKSGSKEDYKLARRSYLFVVVLYKRAVPKELLTHCLCRSALCFEKIQDGLTPGDTDTWKQRKAKLIDDLKRLDEKAAKDCK